MICLFLFFKKSELYKRLTEELNAGSLVCCAVRAGLIFLECKKVHQFHNFFAIAKISILKSFSCLLTPSYDSILYLGKSEQNQRTECGLVKVIRKSMF